MDDAEIKRDDHRRKVEELRRVAECWACGCSGMTKQESDDIAAQLRAEARIAEKNPNYFSMLVPNPPGQEYAAHPALASVKATITAETEAKRDRQVHAGESGKRPWHNVADPILVQLREEHRGWFNSDLREGLKKRCAGLPEDRAIEKHIADMIASGRLLPRQK